MTPQSRFVGTVGRTLADSQAWSDDNPAAQQRRAVAKMGRQ
jgi:hypothetical protein